MRLVLVALAWCGGITFAASLPTQNLLLWSIACLVAVTATGLSFYLGGSRWAAVLILAFSLGGARLAVTPVTSELATQNGRTLTLTGIVSSSPEVRDDGSQRFRVDAESTYDGFEERTVSGAALVATLSQQAIAYGDRVHLTGELSTPGRFDDFDYGDYLAREGVFSQMQNASVIVESSGHGSPVMSAFLSLRDHFGETIQRTLPEPAAGLLRGILLGIDGALAPPVEDAFAATGSAHIVAISGFNMAIVGQSVLGLLSRFGLPKRTAVFVALSVLFTYTVFVGAEPAVVRACLMTSVLILGQLLRRRTYLPASIAFAAVLITAENPSHLFDIGFQLSVAATLGLAMMTEPIAQATTRTLQRLLPRLWAIRVGDFLTEPLAASLAAQIAVTPLIALYFGRLSLVSPLVNLLIVPVQPIIIIVGGIGVMLSTVIPAAGAVLLWIAFTALSWSLLIIRSFAQLPFADTSFRVDEMVVLLTFFVLLGGHLMLAARPPLIQRVFTRLSSRPIVAAALLGAVCLVSLSGMIVFSRPDGQLHVWALDMNGANAVLIETPAGAHILVDGGSSPQRLLTALGDILPFSQRSLDALILTAPIEANYRAVIAASEYYDFRQVFSHGQANLSEAYAALQESLGDSTHTLLTAGAALEWADGTRIDILHPQQSPTLEDDVGDETMVVRVEYGEVSFLLTGELTAEGQDALLTSGLPVQSTVLQLPRHAMPRSLSTEFISAVAPSALFASTQRASRRGDADPDVISRLPALPLMLTHRQGTLHYWTDGSALWVAPEHAEPVYEVR